MNIPAGLADARASACGVFRIGGALFGVPAASLREVTPPCSLAPVADPTGTLLGAIELRGRLIAVVDVARLVGVSAGAVSNFVVIDHDGRELALPCDAVAGVVESDGAAAVVFAAASSTELIPAAFALPELGGVVNLLMPAAIFAMVRAPVERASHDGAGSVAASIAASAVRHMLFLRCGGTQVAIDSEAIETTLFDPRIERSALSTGACVGTIELHGARVLAVDLAAVCGLGATALETPVRAFVARFPEGPLAFLVDEIQDVGTVPCAAETPLSCHFRDPRSVFRGLLVAEDAEDGKQIEPRLVLDAQVLLRDPELRGFARLHQPNESAQVEAGTGWGERQMLLFVDAGHEVAVPVEQVREILAWPERGLEAGAQIGPHSFLVSRGRAIPVYSLPSLLGAPGGEYPGSSACVLVVGDGVDVVGFGAPRLITLELAQRMPLDGTRALAKDEMSSLTWCEPALIEAAGLRRALEVLDLHRLAVELRGGCDGTSVEVPTMQPACEA